MSQPQTEPVYNVRYVKDHYKLDEFVTRDLGKPEKETRSRMLYSCCFHSESTPSLVINKNKQTFRCYGCQRHGSIIDYAIERGYGIDFRDVITYFTGRSAIVPTPKPIIRKAAVPDAPKRMPTMNEVNRYHGNRDTAIPYFHERGIETESVDRFLLGAQVNYNWKYVFKCDQWATSAETKEVPFKGLRYTYPWMSGSDVRMINKRRDDAHGKRVLAALDPELNYMIRADIAQHHNETPKCSEQWTPSDVTDKVILDRCFGPRFDQVGQGTIFNLNRLFCTDDSGNLVVEDGMPRVIALDYCLIVEGEADAIAAEQSGFYAVAAKVKVGVNYRHAFSGTRLPVICVDSDIAGAGYGQSMLEELGRGRILPMKAGFKDVNDMVKAGLFVDWMMKKAFIEPEVKDIVF